MMYTATRGRRTMQELPQPTGPNLQQQLRVGPMSGQCQASQSRCQWGLPVCPASHPTERGDMQWRWGAKWVDNARQTKADVSRGFPVALRVTPSIYPDRHSGLGILPCTVLCTWPLTPYINSTTKAFVLFIGFFINLIFLASCGLTLWALPVVWRSFLYWLVKNSESSLAYLTWWASKQAGLLISIEWL